MLLVCLKQYILVLVAFYIQHIPLNTYVDTMVFSCCVTLTAITTTIIIIIIIIINTPSSPPPQSHSHTGHTIILITIIIIIIVMLIINTSSSPHSHPVHMHRFASENGFSLQQPSLTHMCTSSLLS